jgi:hypothetical protein
MIRLNFTLRNAWSDRSGNIKWWAGGTPFKTKFWEVQLLKSNTVIGTDVEWTVRQDHAGVRLVLGLLGYELDMNIYDNRHWNYEGNRYYIYSEEKGYH